MLIGLADEKIGGAERFFADFFTLYDKYPEAKFSAIFLTDKSSAGILSKLGKLEGNNPAVIRLINVSNRLKKIAEGFDFLWKIVINRVDILHVGSYTAYYYNRVKLLDRLPRFLRPKLVINIVSTELPYQYPLKDKDEMGYYRRFSPLFNNIYIDGIYCWNKLFKEYAEANSIIRSKPLIEAIKSRFSSDKKFFPIKKKKQIVFVSRLVPVKAPLFFLEAINVLVNEWKFNLSGWRFIICGDGPLKKDCLDFIAEKTLGECTTLLDNVPDSSVIVNESLCYVSTQDLDNFPSLAMNEAMTAGNAIIARNVGQTALFVEDGKNGFLAKEDSPHGLAEAIRKYIDSPMLHESFSAHSIRLTQEVHTPANFIRGIESFWHKILQRR